MATAKWKGKTIAHSTNTVVVEGNHYFDMTDVTEGVLSDSSHTTVCPWKGTASYYHVTVDGDTNQDAAWTYRTPSEAAENIRGRVAFWRGIEVTDD